MLITKTNPTGIDNAIQKLQTDLHTKLMSLWGINSADYECYGRAYRNKTDSGYIAELFLGSADQGGKDYKDAYWNDNLKALSFFVVSDKVEADMGQAKTNVSIIFFVNVVSLKPTITHRADEEVRQDVIRSLGTFSFGFKYVGFETGIDNVLREFPGTRKDALVAKVEVQPAHCFRINLSLIYKNNNC